MFKPPIWSNISCWDDWRLVCLVGKMWEWYSVTKILKDISVKEINKLVFICEYIKWRNDMELLSVLLALRERHFRLTNGYPFKCPTIRGFGVFVDVIYPKHTWSSRDAGDQKHNDINVRYFASSFYDINIANPAYCWKKICSKPSEHWDPQFSTSISLTNNCVRRRRNLTWNENNGSVEIQSSFVITYYGSLDCFYGEINVKTHVTKQIF